MSRLAQVSVAKINPSPYNPRHEAVDIEGLSASIAAVGVVEPLVVAVDEQHDGFFTVVCGSRRLAASKLAGLKQVPCQILPPTDERGQRTVSAVENLHRRDMSHIEQGEAFRDLMRTGMTQIEVARALGVSDYTVSVKLQLVTALIPEMRELVHRDRMTLKEALDLSKLPGPVQRRLLERRGKQTRKSALPAHRRSWTETSIMRALAAFREGNLDLALAEVKRAEGLLEQAVGPIDSSSANAETKPAELDEAPPGRVRCPHCLTGVKIRSGDTSADALADHGRDRPFCRQKIAELAGAAR